MHGDKIPDEEILRLEARFVEHLEKYFQRLDVITQNEDEYHHDYLNDNIDEDGFSSYYNIAWENKKYRFNAIRRYESLVIIDCVR